MDGIFSGRSQEGWQRTGELKLHSAEPKIQVSTAANNVRATEQKLQGSQPMGDPRDKK